MRRFSGRIATVHACASVKINSRSWGVPVDLFSGDLQTESLSPTAMMRTTAGRINFDGKCDRTFGPMSLSLGGFMSKSKDSGCPGAILGQSHCNRALTHSVPLDIVEIGLFPSDFVIRIIRTVPWPFKHHAQ
jgi:hypothetical protein